MHMGDDEGDLCDRLPSFAVKIGWGVFLIGWGFFFAELTRYWDAGSVVLRLLIGPCFGMLVG